MANKPNNPNLWSKAKSMAKQKYDIYPSAYSNAAASKWYKSKGGTWRKAKEGGNYYRHMYQTSGSALPYTYSWSAGPNPAPTTQAPPLNKDYAVHTTVPSLNIPVEASAIQKEQNAIRKQQQEKEIRRQQYIAQMREKNKYIPGKGKTNEAGIIGMPDAGTYRALATNAIVNVLGGTPANYAMEIANTIPSATGELLTGSHDYYTALPSIRRSFYKATGEDFNKYGLKDQRTLGNAVFPDNPIGAFALDLPIDLLTTRGANTLFKQGTKYGVKYLPKISRAILPTKFQSEIDWSKWNKEIPSNKDLMKEYTAIEKSSKANGTWMKNADGSAYQGTPEQFVQENSSNFKKAFPEGFDKTYRGSQFLTPRFDRTAFKDKDIITFGTSDESVAKRYSTNNPVNFNDEYQDVGKDVQYWHPDIDVEKIYQGDPSNAKPGMYEILYPKGQKTINAEGQGNRWFNIKQDDVFEGIKQNNYQDFRGRHDYRNYFDPSHPMYMGNEMTYGNVATDDMAAYMIKNDIPVGKVSNVYDGRDYFGNPKPANVTMLNTSILPVKSRWYNNGMFDMTNPNIFKGLAPYLLGTGAATYGINQTMQPRRVYKKSGKFIKPKNINYRKY